MSRKLNFQQLENRDLLAGDVAVFADAADARDLNIVGDNLSNRVLIEEIGTDRIRVTGLSHAGSRTTINGSTRPLEVSVRDDLRIWMQGGNDRVEINDLQLNNATHNDLEVYMGAGSDRLDIEFSFVGDDARLDMGAGNDELYVDELFVRDDLHVSGRDGSDYLNIYDSTAEDLRIWGGTGDDDVYVVGNDVVDELMASLEGGDDLIYLAGNSANRPSLFGGSGSDSLHTSLFNWNDFNAGANSSSFEWKWVGV